jgi:hypothetical protein
MEDDSGPCGNKGNIAEVDEACHWKGWYIKNEEMFLLRFVLSCTFLRMGLKNLLATGQPEEVEEVEADMIHEVACWQVAEGVSWRW